MPRRPVLPLPLLLGCGLLAMAGAPSPAQAAGPRFTCEASALRATVLGQSIEPVVYGRGQPCKTGRSTPVAGVPGVVSAAALVASGTNAGDPLRPSARASGGVSNLDVGISPALLAIPLPNAGAAIAALPNITLPSPAPGLPGASVNVRDIVAAALPGGQLPTASLVSARVLSADAAATCADGKLGLEGASTVTGLKVLGQDVNLDGTVQRNLSLIDSRSFDPSSVTLAQVQGQLPQAVQAALGGLAGGAVTQALQAALQPALDALPTISIPATLAQVTVTPGGQTKTANALTQQAARVQVSLAGNPLVDAVIGEAKVSVTGSCPGAAAVAAQPAELRCTTRKLVLLDVFQQGDQGVKLKGAANRKLAGKTVSIRFSGSGGKVVARATIGKDGGFETFAKTPRKSIAMTNRARYTAVQGKHKSLPLKLYRRMRVSSVVNGAKFVTITGKVAMPLASPVQRVRLRRRIQCGKQRVIASTKPDKNGRFRFRVKATPRPAVYRATTRVRKNRSNKKTYPTFTLPRGVDLEAR